MTYAIILKSEILSFKNRFFEVYFSKMYSIRYNFRQNRISQETISNLNLYNFKVELVQFQNKPCTISKLDVHL